MPRSDTSSSRSMAKPRNMKSISVRRLQPRIPPDYTTAHHVNDPPTSFKNPWPSSPAPHSLSSILKARFFNTSERNFVPIPTDRSLLVPVVKPNWGRADSSSSDDSTCSKLKATWIGHASFLVEFPSHTRTTRGIRAALDPVFSDRMSPVSFLGPKRFTPPPCALEELPTVDLVCISHNHYDHLDAATIRFIHQRGRGRVRFFCGLGVSETLEGMGVGMGEIYEMDWWDRVRVAVDISNAAEDEHTYSTRWVDVVCTPSQHNSARGVSDQGRALWCSFVIEEVTMNDEETDATLASTATLTTTTTATTTTTTTTMTTANTSTPENLNSYSQQPSPPPKKLFFAGDTAYRGIPKDATDEQIAALPVCPAFKQLGDLYGPFDLALLPIGCYSPRWWMSAVHCAPEDSVCVHKDIRSRKSIGMHYGTIRGGISQYYEDVTEPPKRWKEACLKEGLEWGREVGLCDIGETVLA